MKKRKAYPVNGKRVEIVVPVERKIQLENYCRVNKTTAAKVVNTALTLILAPQQSSR